MRIGDIIKEIERIAPLGLQEEWDNSGLQVGDRNAECTGVMLCVDCTMDVLDEAISRGCNLIVSHHPLIFGQLRQLVGASEQQQTIMRAIASGVSIYSSHTALDSSPEGVSVVMARKLGLKDVTILDPRRADLIKLILFAPVENASSIRKALFEAGAGTLGRYDSCSFSSAGTGTFRPLDGSTPSLGNVGEHSAVVEERIEVMLPRWEKRGVELALRRSHPYEEPAYEFVEVEAGSFVGGLGCIGTLAEPRPAREVAMMAKRLFDCGGARVSRLAASDKLVSRVALCGGAGGSLIKTARRAGAEIYVSSDLRYHDFVDHGEQLGLVDVGHFNSEQCAKEIFFWIISEKFPNFAVYSSTEEKNPVEYL